MQVVNILAGEEPLAKGYPAQIEVVSVVTGGKDDHQDSNDPKVRTMHNST